MGFLQVRVVLCVALEQASAGGPLVSPLRCSSHDGPCCCRAGTQEDSLQRKGRASDETGERLWGVLLGIWVLETPGIAQSARWESFGGHFTGDRAGHEGSI